MSHPSDTTPEVEFASALSLFQAELPAVSKGQSANTGTFSYSYADLTAVTEAALPILANHGFAWTATPTITEAGFVLRYALLHKAGHREEGFYPLPDPSKSSSQQIGSALTYARRYALCAVTGIAPGGDDDDGAKASEARASDIAVRDRGRTPGKTQRTRPDGPQEDEWTTPATDAAWLDSFRERLTLCGSRGEVNGLVAEARQQMEAGKLSTEDAKALKAETDARLAELTGAMV